MDRHKITHEQYNVFLNEYYNVTKVLQFLRLGQAFLVYFHKNGCEPHPELFYEQDENKIFN